MKKHSLASIISVLFIVILCVSLFTACGTFERIEEAQLEKIVIWVYGVGEYMLNEEETARFTELYNASKYEGEGTGEGGTAEFGAVVYFRDGTTLRANDFGSFGVIGKDFEVTLRNADGSKTAWYYLNGKELYNFVSELVDALRKS